VIFVHGLDSERSSDGAVDLAARLVGQGYNVLLFDLRGHGRSGGERISAATLSGKTCLGHTISFCRRAPRQVALA
jgi:pimeloyl-ACP methyl ester carboxylesterase